MPSGRESAAEQRSNAPLDRLASLAVLVALGPIPVLGIGHPVTHLLIISIVGAFGWLVICPRQSIGRAVQALDVGWPSSRKGWMSVAVLGIASGILRWLLDVTVLGGQGGIAFYDRVLRQFGMIATDGGARWNLFGIYAPILLLIILLDGVFFSGLIQQRVAAHTNVHLGIQTQALLFALPHTFAGPVPDVAYGTITYLGGIAYGYLYYGFRNHWLPASMLSLHVLTVWFIMLWGRGAL